jgi:hypothetical protein
MISEKALNNILDGGCGCVDFIDKQAEKIKALEEKLESARKHLKFTLHSAEYMYRPDEKLEINLSPMFYHSLTYEGDLELIEKTKAAREWLRQNERSIHE